MDRSSSVVVSTVFTVEVLKCGSFDVFCELSFILHVAGVTLHLTMQQRTFIVDLQLYLQAYVGLNGMPGLL